MTLRLPETRLDRDSTGTHTTTTEIKEAKALQIPEQIAQLEKQIQVTEEYINQLIERLQPILQVELEDRATNEKSTVNLVPLAEDIRSIYFRLSGNVTSKLDYILRSLEI